MMDDASDGPIPSLDPDDLWKRGTRQRRMRQAAVLAPVMVLVLLVGGLAVATRDNTGGGSDDDENGALFADMSVEQDAIIERYLVSLEASGQRGAFADDRAAVEYAWRVECFGDISPIELNAMGAATIDLVTAISDEASVSAAVAAEVATPEELSAARAVTDEARVAYERFIDFDYLRDSSESLVNARETSATRLDDLDLIREAVDGRQMSVRNWTQQLTETSASAVDYLTEASLVSIDTEYIREWERTIQLLRLQIATANLAGGSLGFTVDDGGQHDLDDLAGLIDEEDLLLEEWVRNASPEGKAQLREQTSTSEVREYESSLDHAYQLLFDLDAETTTAADLATVNDNPMFAEQMLARGRTLAVVYAGLHDLTGLPASADAADVALTEAVDQACAATNDEILAVEPSLMAEAPTEDEATPTTASLSTEAPETTAPSATVTLPEAPATTAEQPATTSAPATEPSTATTEAPETTATTALPLSQPDVSGPADLP